MDTAEKRSKIRERLANGELARYLVTAAKILGAQTPPAALAIGTCNMPGHRCSGCSESKTTRHVTLPESAMMCFHDDCFEIWREESQTPQLQRN